MARDAATITADLQDAYFEIDPTADTEKGPIRDLFIRPQSVVMADIEARQDRTDRLASADFTAVATTTELERMAASVGAGASQGKASEGYVYFGSRSRPRANQTITIPQGTRVGSTTLDYVYQTTQAVVIDGRYPDNYYNPTKRTYEVLTPIQAVAVGVAYNVPAYRVTRVLSTITGVDFVENRSKIDKGVDPGGTSALIAQGQAKLIGQDMGTVGGISAAVMAAFDSALSVKVITSADYLLFRRATTKPGIDIYYSGEVLVSAVYEYTALGGEITLQPDNLPIQSVESATVNGLAVAYELVIDDDPATLGSSNDTSHVEFASPLSGGSLVSIKYTWDSLTGDIAEDYAGVDTGLFETDILVRRAVRVNPTIEISAEADSGFNLFSLQTNVLAQIHTWFEDSVFGQTYSPAEFLANLVSEVIGLRTTPTMSVFHLSERGVLDVETIALQDNEIIEIDDSLISINLAYRR